MSKLVETIIVKIRNSNILITDDQQQFENIKKKNIANRDDPSDNDSYIVHQGSYSEDSINVDIAIQTSPTLKNVKPIFSCLVNV